MSRLCNILKFFGKSEELQEVDNFDLPTKRIAVIGGGPKAVALAVKAKVLADLGIQRTEVVIFEKQTIGAAWTGDIGYSDGEQRLCTLAERDLGFPYNSLNFGEKNTDVNLCMLKYSWQRFLVSRELKYSSWVDSGRKPPKHSEFAEYLKWALQEANNIPTIGRVDQVKVVQEKWVVEYSDKLGSACVYPEPFDGIVMTGPGPAKCLSVKDKQGNLTECSRIFNGEDFWRRSDDLKKLIDTIGSEADDLFDSDILIIGGGGTAAATLAWLLSHGCMKHSIQVVASRAVLHTRVDSLFENRLFSDEDTWKTLSKESQDDLFNRLNRGVVWATVIDKISAAENLEIKDGKVTSVEVAKDGGHEHIAVTVVQGNGSKIVITPNIMIDATGFDPLWFKSLLPDWPENVIPAQIESLLGPELQYLSPWKLPLLHLPMFSKRVGPGFASLMVLGSMADHILFAYNSADFA